MSEKKDMTEEVKSLLKEARSAKMNVTFAAYHVYTIPRFVGTILKPRVARFSGLIENLTSVTQGRYEVSEGLSKSMLSLKTAMSELEESPTQEKVKGLGDDADSISLDFDAILRPVK